jgi:hypothetical protein
LRSRAYPQNNHQTNQSHHNHYNAGQPKQRAYQQQQHPLYHMPGSGAGLSDTPTSGNASDETLTDSDLITVARDSALLVHNGELNPPVVLRGYISRLQRAILSLSLSLDGTSPISPSSLLTG